MDQDVALHRKGSWVCFPTFTKRFFDMFYGEQAMSFEGSSGMDLETKEWTVQRFRPAFAEGGYAQAGVKLLQHTQLPLGTLVGRYGFAYC
jgi:hypothetical protein